MLQPVTAYPETLKIVQTIHDTVHVVLRDTIVRVAEPQVAVRWVSIGAGLATIFAAGVAVWGILAWRDELRGTTEYRLAVRVYRGVLRLRDRIQSTRDELNHRIMLTREEANNREAVLSRRYKTYGEFFREVVRADLALRDLRPEIEIHWGMEGTRHIDALDEMARKLRGGQWAYFNHLFKALGGDATMADAAEGDRRIAFAPTGDGPDEYGEELRRRIDEAVAFLRPKVKR
jgi:hypothetical protein